MHYLLILLLFNVKAILKFVLHPVFDSCKLNYVTLEDIILKCDYVS